MNSLWSETVKTEEFAPLTGDVKTDVLIIGGGMAGILCAYYLQKAGVRNILAERNRIGGGITKNTTAKITAQHGLIYQKLMKDIGPEKTGLYLEANRTGLKEYRKLAASLDCDFEEKDAYIYSLDNGKIIEDELTALHKIKADAAFKDSVPLPFKIAGAVQFPKQAQFHPLKFISGLSKGLKIYEHTEIKELEPHSAVTEHGRIAAKHIIVAAHFPFLNKHGLYFMKMYQHRSYTLALENAPDLDGMYLEEKEDGLSFRNHKNFLIIGGGDHRTGKTGGDWCVLRDLAVKSYPGASERYAWAAQDCMTLDGIPYIGRYGKNTDGLYVTTGFNKWGMTSSVVSAMILTDMILGRKNEYAEIFSPQRKWLKPQLFINGMTAAGNLLTPSTKRCPHLGCALKWNEAEQSWDCPCHGSRFGRSGLLMDNPAVKGIKI